MNRSLNLWHFNLALQGGVAIDPAPLWGVAEQVVSWGGFAELSFLPRTDLVVFTRLDGASSRPSKALHGLVAMVPALASCGAGATTHLQGSFVGTTRTMEPRSTK